MTAVADAAAETGRRIAARIDALIEALRASGAPVAVSDGLDARRAALAIDLADREQLRAALAATLLRQAGHRAVFDRLFDLHFPPRVGAVTGGGVVPRGAPELLEDLVEALATDDRAGVDHLVTEAVEAFGRIEGRDGRPGYYLYRVLREINPAGLLRRLIDAVGADDDLQGRLVRDELTARVERFRTGLEAEVRRHSAEVRGPDAVARTITGALPEDVDFFRVSADDEAAMRRAIRPLARRLAARLAVRRRRGRDGRLDVRRTLRGALATGGVPIDPVFAARRAHRPELVVVCDVSGSVAAFARFTLLFCHALASQFSRVRSFAFIDAVDEVTHLFAEGDPADALGRLATEADVVWLDGHSDYGNALSGMTERFGDAITPRSTVLILGDARTNYRAPADHVLAGIAHTARRTFWLNPEPAAYWGSGDSVADTYARHCDAMVECRNLRQLAAFVERIA